MERSGNHDQKPCACAGSKREWGGKDSGDKKQVPRLGKKGLRAERDLSEMCLPWVPTPHSVPLRFPTLLQLKLFYGLIPSIG